MVLFIHIIVGSLPGYIEARDIGTEGRVRVESVVQEALEYCITHHGLDPALPAAAATTLTHHLNAVRNKLLLRYVLLVSFGPARFPSFLVIYSTYPLLFLVLAYEYGIILIVVLVLRSFQQISYLILWKMYCFYSFQVMF